MSDANVIGKQISQYKIEEQIGQGGMATVYKAYQSSINRHVAIKILPTQYAQDPNFVKRFEQEARAIAALEHPHILPVYDFGTQDGLTYMVMRYVRGGTLTNLMGTPLSYERIVRLVSDVARALDYAHKQGVVHRDIKPSNILIDKNGEALLTDFGIAKLIEGSSGATQLTGSGTILGTPAYMSPEQAKAQHVDGRSDVYSLGVVLYELLTGQQPFQAETPVAVVLKHVSEPLPLPRLVKADVPEPLERVVLKAMAKEPGQRYQTAEEMGQALQAALREIENRAATVSVPATTQTPTQSVTNVVPPPAQKKGGLGPLLIGGGAVVALLCLGGVGLAFYGLSSVGDEPTSVAVSKTPVSIGLQPTATPTTPPPTATPETVATTAAPPEDTPTSQPEETPTAIETTEPEETPTSDTGVVLPDISDNILLEDNFDDNKNDWFTGDQSDEYGLTSAEFVDGKYRVKQEAKQGVFVWNSLSQTKFLDFMLSIEATPVEHNAAFSYGVTLRENSKGDLYIFEVDTDGNYGVSVRADGEWKTLVDWTQLKAINKDATNQLTVQVSGSSFMFLVNGQLATMVEDDSLKGGAVGVALDLYNEGDKATVDFDNLLVINFSPEGVTLDNRNEGSGEIIFEDTFDNDASGWATGEFDDDYSVNTATVENGKYTISVEDKDQAFVEKLLPNREFDDFILSIEATPLDTGENYAYGVSFREDSSGDIFYAFEIGNDGQYAVLLFDGEWKRLKDWSTSKAIKVGEMNKIMISAEGDSLTFYVNDEKLTTLTNDVSAEGKIGLVVAMFEQGTSAEVEFDNLVIRRP
jgi:serine/threonine protein kinase